MFFYSIWEIILSSFLLQKDIMGKKNWRFESLSPYVFILNILDELPAVRAEEISTFLPPTVSWYYMVITSTFRSVIISSHHWIVSVLCV